LSGVYPEKLWLAKGVFLIVMFWLKVTYSNDELMVKSGR
jgi:hypothetical protein